MLDLKRDFLIILVGKFIQVIIIVFTLKVSTIILNPEELGSFYLFTTLYTMFILTFISPFGHYINRHTHEWRNKNKLLDNLYIFFIYTLLVSFISIVIGFILYNVFNVANVFDEYVFILLIAIFIIGLTWSQTITPTLNMLNYRVIFTVLTIFTYLGILLLGVLFTYLFSDSTEFWLLGIVSSHLFFAIIALYSLKKRIKENFSGFYKNLQKIDKTKIKQILNFVLPLGIATLFMWSQNSGYRIIIEQTNSLEFLGYLGLGLAISLQIASVFESVLMQYFQPIYYEEITNTTKEARIAAINKFINKIIPLYLILTIYVTFCAKFFVPILIDEKYYGVYVFTIFGIWVEFFRMNTNLFAMITQSEVNTRKIMKPYIIGALITIIGVYFSSHLIDYDFYIPISLVIGGFFTVFLMYFAMKKLLDFTINLKSLIYTLVLSVPFYLIYQLSDRLENLWLSSYIVIGLASIYLLLCMYLIYKYTLKVNYGN